MSAAAGVYGLCATLPLSAQDSAVPTDLFLLVGQSNMAGRGKVEEEDKKPYPRVLVLNKSDQWAEQGEPIHFDKNVAGVGLGFTFGKLCADKNPSAVIGLIPCAVGGTSMDQWQPDKELYQNAIRRAKLAMQTGKLKAILWHQGEAECGSPEKAAAYAERLAKLIESFRKDLNQPAVPVIVGQLGEFLYTRPVSPQAKVVNEQILLLPSKVANCAAVQSNGLKDKGDQLHFDSASAKELGRRYFEAYTALLSAPKPN